MMATAMSVASEEEEVREALRERRRRHQEQSRNPPVKAGVEGVVVRRLGVVVTRKQSCSGTGRSLLALVERVEAGDSEDERGRESEDEYQGEGARGPSEIDGGQSATLARWLGECGKKAEWKI